MGKIVHVRLINGDEVMGELMAENKSVVTLKDTLVVDEIKNNDNGTSSIFLSKYTLSDELTLNLKANHILTITTVSPIIEDYYKHSVDYSKNYIEPNKLSEIEKVSAVLASYNRPNEEDLIILKAASSSYQHRQSNTSH